MKASDAMRLRIAASVMADQFSSSVLGALQEVPPRTFLYQWEWGALDWLREQIALDPETEICSWTGHYLRHGPPPWASRGLK